MLDLKVGQELWFVGRWSYERVGYPVTVDKIGRQYARLDNGYRIALNQDRIAVLCAEYRGDEAGTCYTDEAAYREYKAAAAAYRNLRNSLPPTCPINVTLADIEAVKALLHMGDGK